MQKKTIIFILPDMETGGAERIVMTIANHLPADAYEPKIMLLRKEGAYLEDVHQNIEIINLNINRIRYSLFPILKEIKKRKPDLVFCGFGEVNAYLSFFVRFFSKTKFIARETNVVSQHVTRKEIKFFYRFYNNFDKIICQSDDMKQDLVENFGIIPSKIKKINNPVDFDFIDAKLSNAQKPEVYSEGYKHLIAVGNLSARKGFDNLLKVMYELKNENIILHILGDGRDKETLQQMKLDLDLKKVFFHGKKNNPYVYMKFADLFILSSRYEGFPNVLLEAGACGLYSLANNCPGGINEIIQTSINGEIASIEDHKVFAEAIKHILSRAVDPQSIRQSIESRFTKNIIIKQYENLFDECIQDKN